MPNRLWFLRSRWVVLLALGGAVAVAWGLRAHWMPKAQQLQAALQARLKLGKEPPAGEKSRDGESADGHSHEGHDHTGHDETNSVELSAQARETIGLKTGKITLGTFVRTIPVPAIAVERRGRTKTRVVAPLTGIVTNVHVIQGEAVQPGEPLFDLRMTHEDLLQAQVEFLRIAEELDVVNREVERLSPVVEKGAIPQKTLLDRQYEQKKLQGAQRAQRESLLLHGLSAKQVDEILETRTLRSNLTVYAPEGPNRTPHTAQSVRTAKVVAAPPAVPQPSREEASVSNQTAASHRMFVIEEMLVENGRLVTAGDPLLTLADYSELYIEGNAFEQDGNLIADAIRQKWKVTAIVENHTPTGTAVPGLDILFLSDQVDAATRTLHFYLRLPNEKTRDEVVDGHRFVNWRYKPGQRTQLRVPVERWPDRIVLPAEAVVQDGAESFVFQENGDHFDRRPVRVEYRDLQSAVISQDGSLFPGDVVALSGAAQMQIALKNKAGGGVDPHAGHQH